MAPRRVVVSSVPQIVFWIVVIPLYWSSFVLHFRLYLPTLLDHCIPLHTQSRVFVYLSNVFYHSLGYTGCGGV